MTQQIRGTRDPPWHYSALPPSPPKQSMALSKPAAVVSGKFNQYCVYY